MNRLGARCDGRINDALPLQVAFFGRVAANRHSLVATGHVLGLCISVGIHRHGTDAHLAGSRRNAAGDFATIGNQDLAKHGLRGLLKSGPSLGLSHWVAWSCQPYMRKIPNWVSAMGAFSDALKPSASRRRVSAGSIMPSSHSRAVA